LAWSDGQQAIDQAAAQSPDIVLLDMMMPEKDGMQACRESQQPGHRNVPIILITAHCGRGKQDLTPCAPAPATFLPQTLLDDRTARSRGGTSSSLTIFSASSRARTTLLESTIEQLKNTETHWCRPRNSPHSDA